MGVRGNKFHQNVLGKTKLHHIVNKLLLKMKRMLRGYLYYDTLEGTTNQLSYRTETSKKNCRQI